MKIFMKLQSNKILKIRSYNNFFQNNTFMQIKYRMK